MQLTTTFGSAQLALQNALLKGIAHDSNHPVSPNFLLVSVNRERFAVDYPGDAEQQIRQFKAELSAAAQGYITSNGWRTGGTGSLIINLLLASIQEDCTVRARIVDPLYRLAITDGEGDRSIGVRRTHTTVGRAHQPHPPGFVAINDPDRIMSREHLQLTYSDLKLRVKLSGKNPTTLGNAPLGSDPQELNNGDIIICGRTRIELRDLPT